MVKIKKITVENLFDYYCYEIEMKSHANISIIHAPNGYGKTTVFNLVKYCLDFDVINIASIPFDGFILELTDNTRITVKKFFVENHARKTKTRTMVINICDSEKKEVDFKISISGPAFSMIRNVGLDEYIRRMEMRRRHTPVEERENEEAFNFVRKYDNFNEKLKMISKSLGINFIESNRLFSNKYPSHQNKMNFINDSSVDDRIPFFSDDLYDDEFDRDEKKENILEDAQDIQKQIREARQKYSLESEKKDRNFPDRLVECVRSSSDPFDDDKIAKELEKLEKKRLELEKAGLVLSGKKTLAPTASIDDTMRRFYTLYIQDTLEKLSVYDEIKSKLELFIEIINKKTAFSNKKMRISNEKGVVFEPVSSKSGKKHIITLDKLSSGEKHDFIMFYELIFNSNNTSVILIDEPEISLHVAWQMQFIDVLEKICDLNGIQAIIATHSPDIVNGHDDLLISLREENDANA